MSHPPEQVPALWSPVKKVLFRFVFSYVIFYVLPLPNTGIPFTDWLGEHYDALWKPLVMWTGKNVFNLSYEISVLPNGSGDTTFNYIQVFLFFALSVVLTIAWTVLDRKRQNYERLLSWLTIYIRYYLGIVALGYGFAKVIKTQFPFPYLSGLLEPYGESSPMRLLWTFMGYSTAYNVFAGMGEVLGGLLLFFRRTKMLGALVLVVIMSHVVILNFAYDVPVKLFSSHLLLMALFLLAPDAVNLWKFLVLRKVVEPIPCEPFFKQTRWRKIHLTAKVIFILFLIGYDVVSHLSFAQGEWGDYAPQTALSGIYEVETVVLKNDTLPPLQGTRRWKRVLIDNGKSATVEYMDGSLMWARFGNDSVKHILTLTPLSSLEFRFEYQRPDSLGRASWKGTIDKDSLNLVVKKRDRNDFLLVNRGFHWINEYPLNK